MMSLGFRSTFQMQFAFPKHTLRCSFVSKLLSCLFQESLAPLRLMRSSVKRFSEGKLKQRLVDVYHPEWTTGESLSLAVELFRDGYALGQDLTCRRSSEWLMHYAVACRTYVCQ